MNFWESWGLGRSKNMCSVVVLLLLFACQRRANSCNLGFAGGFTMKPHF